ncbi:putative N-acetylated-alpha-linked acidic dipeptidase [Physella acuta]|uniref:putative N-acetylated-alpha-linked acidic dipeptidase n=1 Tax=Physella acuta TaxID=109671 RepID=UPI0027DD9BF9|nr:putative N-acetylated-alpha-linked acidic dipeptidase [Physella acuta]
MMRGFDSIESMNADELLVKRKRGSKRFVVGAAVIGALFFLVGILIGFFSHETEQPIPAPPPKKLDPAQFIIENVDVNFLKNKLKNFTSQVRTSGNEGNNELADKLKSMWSDSGVDKIHTFSYNVLLSFANLTEPNKVEILNKTSGTILFTSSAFEPKLQSDERNSSTLSYNAYCPSGIVSGDAVYVNYGRVEDLEYLVKNLSLNITGQIFIARYGKIFAGNKVLNAENYNASGIILYSDPADVNQAKNKSVKPYPDSWWLPSTGITRGTVYMGTGDPMTPGYPSTDYGFYKNRSKDILPRIPCQPISYGDAMHILGNLSGHAAPTSWKGTLPIDYKVGPGYENNTELELKMTVNNYLETKQVQNVIGVIQGREEPDRYVLLGNHHDSWMYGAADPQSGNAALSQAVNIFGQLLKKGYRPRRTLVFCSWDAEEFGLIGSTEWIESNLKIVGARVVAYLNVETAALGTFTMQVATSPLLQDALYAAAKQIPSPEKEFKTLYDLWLAKSDKNLEPRLSYSLGGGSSYAAFYQQVGVSCADFHFTFNEETYPMSNYPLHHSSYDNYFSYEHYHDPEFKYAKAITQFWTTLANNIANAQLLPFNVSRFSSALKNFLTDLMSKYEELWKKNQVNLDALLSAVNNFTKATEEFESQLAAEKDLDKQPYKLRMYNDQIMQLERAFIYTGSLPAGSSSRNIIFGPSHLNFYKDSFFPGIVETMYTIEKGEDEWNQLKQQVFLATFYIQSAVQTLTWDLTL